MGEHKIEGVSFGEKAARLQQAYDVYHSSEIQKLADEADQIQVELQLIIGSLTELNRVLRENPEEAVDLSHITGLENLRDLYGQMIDESPLDFGMTNPFPQDLTQCTTDHIETMVHALEQLRGSKQSMLPRITMRMQEKAQLLAILAEISKEMVKTDITLVDRIQRRMTQIG